MDIALRHVRFYRFGIVYTKLAVAFQEFLKLSLCFQKFLPRPPEQRPGDVKFLAAIPGKLKIQNAADMVILPENIPVVEIAVAETRA